MSRAEPTYTYLPAAVRDRLDQLAAARGMSRAGVVRMLVIDGLRNLDTEAVRR